MKVGIFGLGEAGSLFAADLAAAGLEAVAFDTADVPTPPGVTLVASPAEAVAGAKLILAITAAADAPTARRQAGDLAEGVLYADLSTSSPAQKRDLAALGGSYVDVALLGVVPGKGLRTPAAVAGPAAARYVELVRPLGVPVEVVGDRVGDAVARKLMRSIVMKGLASVVIEAMEAASAVGLEDWLWENIVEEISRADESLLRRLVEGTGKHAVRRLEEMEAAVHLVQEHGVDPTMTASVARALRRVVRDGLPVRGPRHAR